MKYYHIRLYILCFDRNKIIFNVKRYISMKEENILLEISCAHVKGNDVFGI